MGKFSKLVSEETTLNDIMAALRQITDRLDAIEQGFNEPEIIVIETNELRDDTIIPVPEVTEDNNEDEETQPDIAATNIVETREQELERQVQELQDELLRRRRRERSRRQDPYGPTGEPNFPWDQWHRYYSRISHNLHRRGRSRGRQYQYRPYEITNEPRRYTLRRDDSGFLQDPETGERYTRDQIRNLFGANFLDRFPQFSPSEEEE